MAGARLAIGSFCAMFLAGCASAHHLPVKRAEAIGSCQTAVPNGDLLLGIALSGGGSRAALFGVQQRGRVMERDFYIRERWKLLRPITPIDIGMDPCPASLYGVAAASASFPPFIGPISLKVGDEEVYWLTR